MRNQINEWLKNPTDYLQGLKLYDAVKTENSRDDFFAITKNATPTALQQNILAKTLSTMLRRLPPTPNIETKPIQVQTESKPQFIEGLNIDVDKLPEEAKIKYKQIKEITIKLNELHQRLKQATSNKEREPIAKQLALLNQTRQEHWLQINDFIKNPQNHETKDQNTQTKTPKPPTAKELITATRRQKIVRDNIARAKRELENPENLSERQLENRKRSLENWETELQKITKMLLDAKTG